MKQVFLIELSDLGYTPDDQNAVIAFQNLRSFFADILDGSVSTEFVKKKVGEIEKYLNAPGKYYYPIVKGSTNVIYSNSVDNVPIMAEVLRMYIELTDSGFDTPIGISYPRYHASKKEKNPAKSLDEWVQYSKAVEVDLGAFDEAQLALDPEDQVVNEEDNNAQQF